MAKKYVVELSAEERGALDAMVGKGKALARKLAHARVLLKADSGPHGPGWTDGQIAEALGVGLRTVERIRQRFVEHGLEDALTRRQRPNPPRAPKLDGAAEARLVRLVCCSPPAGRRRWSIRLLADKLAELEVVDGIGRETVRLTLKKMKLNLG